MPWSTSGIPTLGKLFSACLHLGISLCLSCILFPCIAACLRSSCIMCVCAGVAAFYIVSFVFCICVSAFLFISVVLLGCVSAFFFQLRFLSVSAFLIVPVALTLHGQFTCWAYFIYKHPMGKKFRNKDIF